MRAMFLPNDAQAYWRIGAITTDISIGRNQPRIWKKPTLDRERHELLILLFLPVPIAAGNFERPLKRFLEIVSWLSAAIIRFLLD